MPRLRSDPEVTRTLHYVCGTCEGRGRLLVPRAMFHRGQVGTAHAEQDCRDCGGTGWIPPKHGQAPLPDEDD